MEPNVNQSNGATPVMAPAQAHSLSRYAGVVCAAFVANYIMIGFFDVSAGLEMWHPVFFLVANIFLYGQPLLFTIILAFGVDWLLRRFASSYYPKAFFARYGFLVVCMLAVYYALSIPILVTTGGAHGLGTLLFTYSPLQNIGSFGP
ncbi:MAG: hypothetical protein RI911_82 [Candidatus Parcubacteria bacterium]|jgi:hypothetical protein